jgi:hypothetical protein
MLGAITHHDLPPEFIVRSNESDFLGGNCYGLHDRMHLKAASQLQRLGLARLIECREWFVGEDQVRTPFLEFGAPYRSRCGSLGPEDRTPGNRIITR